MCVSVCIHAIVNVLCWLCVCLVVFVCAPMCGCAFDVICEFAFV